MIKYALHPGEMISKSDGDMHYISAIQLASLYKVSMTECIVIKDGEPGNSERPDLIHLWPKYDGDYKLPG